VLLHYCEIFKNERTSEEKGTIQRRQKGLLKKWNGKSG
jgi:hypothetical protein